MASKPYRQLTGLQVQPHSTRSPQPSEPSEPDSPSADVDNPYRTIGIHVSRMSEEQRLELFKRSPEEILKIRRIVKKIQRTKMHAWASKKVCQRINVLHTISIVLISSRMSGDLGRAPVTFNSEDLS